MVVWVPNLGMAHCIGLWLDRKYFALYILPNLILDIMARPARSLLLGIFILGILINRLVHRYDRHEARQVMLCQPQLEGLFDSRHKPSHGYPT